MKRTRAQMLWTFQLYLDALKIFDPERRERLSAMFLERALSRHTERDFLTWLKTNRLTLEPVLVRTRGSRLMFFSSWLNMYRPFADKDERERLIRFYCSKSLARDIEREFHRYVKKEVLKTEFSQVDGDGTGAVSTDIASRSSGSRPIGQSICDR